MDAEVWLRLAAALGIGLLVGADRERRKGDGPERSAAGIRTFAVGALLGAVSQIVGGAYVLAAVALGVALLSAVAYWRRHEADPGLTTEVALVLTVLLGALAMNDPIVAGGLGVTLAALLFMRSRIHAFVKSVLTERELNDALVLGAAALVVLPLIPNRQMGPFEAFNPRTLWMIVVLVMAMGAMGHLARRILGPRFGLPVTGFAGGFVSSTATIASLGQLAKSHAQQVAPAVAGAALSSVATVIQMAVVLAITSRAALHALALPLICSGAVAAIYGGILMIRGLRTKPPKQEEQGGAFSIVTALVLAATISAMLFLAAAIQHWLGQTGVIVAAALAGFADAHASAASVASLVATAHLDAHASIVPILAVLTTNAVTKAIVAGTGGRSYAFQVIIGLILMMAAAWAAAIFVPRG